MASPIAGPSRIPYNAIRRTIIKQRVPAGSRYASSSTSTGEEVVDQRTQEAEDAYRSWIRSTGLQYESVRTGQRALWLGGSHPFPANPSFRPPPPLSDDMQNVLYEKLRSGSTVSQLSHRYNISKARIEAIRKLKDVEQEFKRQHLPLQQAFLKGMEGLLGVKSPLDPMTKTADNARERDEATQRAAHPSTGVERVEEDRWDAGIGQGGSFGDRATQATSEGIERTVWEFRDEETEMKEKRAIKEAELAAKAKPGVRAVAEEVLAAQAGSATPESARVVEAMTNRPVDQAKQEAQEAKEEEAHSAKRGGFNFVDVSGQAKWAKK